MNRQSGVTLIELMIGVAIMALLIMLAAPSLSGLIQNRQIRTSAESVSSGLQLARAEAMKNNAQVMFSLTTTLTDSCILSAVGPDWVVSSTDPSNACASSTQVIQKRSDSESKAKTVIMATQNGVEFGQITFNGLGRVTPNQAFDFNIDVRGPADSTCAADAGDMRCLRVVVTPGGLIRLCDPAVTYDLTKSQGC